MFKILITLLLITLVSFSAVSAIDADTYFDFLKSQYNLHDRNLYDFLESELTAFIELYSDNELRPEAMYLLGKVYLEDNRPHQALGLFVKTLFLNPGSKYQDIIISEIRSIMVSERNLEDKKDYIKAIIDMEIDESEKSERYYQYLDWLYGLLEPKLYRWSLNHYYDFLTLYPDHAQIDRVHRWIAETYAADGDYKAGVAGFKKYEQLYPDSPHTAHVQNRRGVILYKNLKNYEQAEKIFSSVIENFPKSPEVGEALFLRADIKAKKSKNYTGAINDLSQLVNDIPDHQKAVPALFEIAQIKEKKLKSFIAAIETYEQMVQSYPEHARCAEALEMAGKLHMKINETAGAVEKYAQIAEDYPNYPDAPDLLLKAASLSESKLKDINRAREYYQLVKDKYPDTDFSRKADKRLAGLDN
jgi:TolA-binding protein